MKILAGTVSCTDFYVEQRKQHPGGNALNFLTQCAKMKAGSLSVIGAVGNDCEGEAVRKHYRKWGIDSSLLYDLPGKTASNKIYINFEGDRYFLPDSWDNGVYGDFRISEEDWGKAKRYDVWAMASLDQNFSEALKRKPREVRFTADFLDTADVKLMESSLPVLDFLFASGNRELAEFMKGLSAKSEAICVTTFGAEGSSAFYRGKEYFQKAVPIDRVIDTTGCGDSFQAAFVVTYLKRHDIAEALCEGAKAASEVLKNFGGY